MTCQADKGQWAIGQIADDALVAKVKADTTSDRVRVIRPGMAVTMDYREDRVNLPPMPRADSPFAVLANLLKKD